MERPSAQQPVCQGELIMHCADDDPSPATPAKASGKKSGPQKAPRKVPLSIRLHPEIVEAFRSSGAGWQRRMNLALLQWLSANSPSSLVIPDHRAPSREKRGGQ
jgi:uncharacterized protein (DUF4415 family)